MLEQSRIEVRAHFNRDVIYRQWTSEQGGVYVPVSKQVPPNPYLSFLPEHDVITPSGKILTLVNPAYMTRQVHEYMARGTNVRGHLTSLKPLQPGNTADAWEKEALLRFKKGETEVSGVSEIDGVPYMRLMRPLEVEEACMQCHAQQGYIIGEF